MESVPWQSTLPPIDHLLILVASAASFIFLALPAAAHESRSDGRSIAWMFGGAALTALPVPFVLFLGTDEYLWTGKEGILEAVSEGLLGALFVLGLLKRNPWIAVGSLLLMLEEIDYGQYFLSEQARGEFMSTPRWIREASGYELMTFNFHNLPVVGTLWRAVPAIGIIVLSLRPFGGRLEFIETWLTRLRLPSFHHLSRYAVLFYFIITPLSGLIMGGIRLDESAELGVVAMIGAAWWCAPQDD